MIKLFVMVLIAALALESYPAFGQWIRTESSLPGYVTCLSATGDSIFAETISYQTHIGNLFLSTDRGGSWVRADNGLPSNIAYSTALTLSNVGGTLFLGMNDSGLYRSTNGGASWVSSGLNGINVTCLQEFGGKLFAGAFDSGMYVSTNNGSTWTHTGPTGPNYFSYRTFGTKGTNLFAIEYDKGVYISTDSGATWATANNGLSPYLLVFTDVAVMGNILFVSNGHGTDNLGGVFRSDDNGTHWTPMNKGLVDSNVNTLAVIGSNLFAGTESNGVYLSTDSGKSWSPVNAGLTNLGIFKLCVSGDNLYIGTDSTGVWQRPVSQMASFSDVNDSQIPKTDLRIFPNPFSRSANINFNTESAGYAEITIANFLGTRQSQIFSGELAAGNHSFLWEAPISLANDIYECIIRMNGAVRSIPIVLER